MKVNKVISVFVVCAVAAFANAQESISPQLKSDVEQFAKDLKSDVSDSQVTSAEVDTFVTSLETALSTAHKPNPTYVAALKLTIRSAVQAGTITPAEKTEIQKEIALVLTSAGVTEANALAVKDAAMAIWKSSNFTRSEGRELLKDVKAIVRDLPSAPKQP